MIELNGFLRTPLGVALVAVVAGVLLLGSASIWWRPLNAWWWRRAVKGLPDYVRVSLRALRGSVSDSRYRRSRQNQE